MRNSASFITLLLLTSLHAGGLSAQMAQPPRPIIEVDSSVTGAPSWKHRLLTGLGAAALGAGAGFFASQVNESDWAEIPGQREAKRGLWAALGGGAGFALGFSFPIRGRAPTRDPLRAVPGGRSVIPFEEVRNVSADNAYDVVRLLRPEWLNTRPPDQLGELTAEGSAVYLDDFRFGDIDALRSIHVSTISSIRFISASAATARWGSGNAMGVIQVLALP